MFMRGSFGDGRLHNLRQLVAEEVVEAVGGQEEVCLAIAQPRVFRTNRRDADVSGISPDFCLTVQMLEHQITRHHGVEDAVGMKACIPGALPVRHLRGDDRARRQQVDGDTKDFERHVGILSLSGVGDFSSSRQMEIRA
jgi:hypothetical protein